MTRIHLYGSAAARRVRSFVADDIVKGPDDGVFRCKFSFRQALLDLAERVFVIDSAQLAVITECVKENQVANSERNANVSHAWSGLHIQTVAIDQHIASVTEPIDEKPEGKLMETILAGFAQFDNDKRIPDGDSSGLES